MGLFVFLSTVGHDQHMTRSGMCELDFSNLAGTGDDNVMYLPMIVQWRKWKWRSHVGWLLSFYYSFLSRVNFFFEFKGSKDSILQEQN